MTFECQKVVGILSTSEHNSGSNELFRNDSLSPFRQDGKINEFLVTGCMVFSCMVRGTDCVIKWTIALLQCLGRPRYLLRNFVKVASTACKADCEQADIQRGRPYEKTGSMYTLKSWRTTPSRNSRKSTLLYSTPILAEW